MFSWDGIHPLLKAKLTTIQDAMLVLGFPMHPVQGLRTTAQQQALFAQVPRVTKADGVIHRSNHQASLVDGLGHAVDMAFVGPAPFAESHPWALYGAMVEALGLRWGGGKAFLAAGINDRPHAELIG